MRVNQLSMPYYAVQNGRTKGVYTDWSSCQKQVQGFTGAIYKKFNTEQQAKEFASRTDGYRSAKLSTPKPVVARGSIGSSREARIQPRDAPKLRDRSPSRHQVREVYVDGACRGNGRHKLPAAGYGVFYGVGDPRNAAVPMSEIDKVYTPTPATNQRAELAAIRHVLRDIIASDMSEPYRIMSDSKYSIEAITNWLRNWERNGWKTSKNEPVLNRDLIEDCVALYKQVGSEYAKRGWRLEFEHVRGHQGIEGNEQADRLANEGADKHTSR